ncbi:hypothetical protein CHU32_19275 [Superficieibacter electus]|uniref:Uncharacterized protein n=1 Tax=Superficieibacter electus TaxID=2022662 RepID=A0A2P5GL86_9ENTR|nr:hypothetical protein [Superficieibacter electus]POP42708.1 hypothetical protein CHU33_18900 [Superficieibacter electus]POP45784.1 hypothetical protein CHU32_19275 [Superficieibacter electus]
MLSHDDIIIIKTRLTVLLNEIFPDDEQAYWKTLLDSVSLSVFLSQLISLFAVEKRYLPCQAEKDLLEAARCCQQENACHKITAEYRLTNSVRKPCPYPPMDLCTAGYALLQTFGTQEERAIPFEEYDIIATIDEVNDVAELDFLPKIPEGVSWMEMSQGGPGMTIFLTLSHHQLISYHFYR